MKRTSKFILITVTAAVTFGSLVAIEGPKDWGHYHGYHRDWHQHSESHHYYDHNDQKTLPDKDENAI